MDKESQMQDVSWGSDSWLYHASLLEEFQSQVPSHQDPPTPHYICYDTYSPYQSTKDVSLHVVDDIQPSPTSWLLQNAHDNFHVTPSRLGAHTLQKVANWLELRSRSAYKDYERNSLQIPIDLKVLEWIV
jgi:hypothetical protein